MKISFFTENNFIGTVPRANAGRTDTSWMASLNASHHCILSNTLDDPYDLGIIIVPKKNPTLAFSYFERNRHKCKKWAVMQEANHSFWQNWSVLDQISFINFLEACDIIFCHNRRDVLYYKGLYPSKSVFVLPRLLLEDAMPKNIVEAPKRSGCMLGGNWTEWYSGQDSFFIARHFDVPIYAPSMGRKQDREDEIEEIDYVKYMDWTSWMAELSKRKYAVHLMRTNAAGTFSLNCARLGIPCIGWDYMDTQGLCFPELSFKEGDMVSAIKAVNHLKTNEPFYKYCVSYAVKAYEDNFTEKVFLEKFNSYF